MKKKLSFLMVVFGLLFLAACGGSGDKEATDTEGTGEDAESTGGEELVLKMANITQADHELSLVLERIGDKLEERTDGRITAEYYPAGQLGNEADMMQQLNTGSIDIGNITTAQLSNSSDAFGAWLLPFLVEDHDQVQELWSSDEAFALFDTLTDENVKGLGFTSSGFRYFLSTKPITEAKDLDGYKIRTTPSPTILDFYNELGSAPTPMPLTEVFTSLQTGVIDGIDIDSESVYAEKLTEIAQDLTPSNHMYWATGLLVNQDLWDSLSAEDQELIQEVAEESIAENVKQVDENEKEMLETIEAEHGVTIHELADKSEFDEIVEKLTEEWGAKSPEAEAFINKAKEIREK